jgi:formylglycine-generating enzyme required for sulfatase activity
MKPRMSSTSIGLELSRFVAVVFRTLLGLITLVAAQTSLAQSPLEGGTGSESEKFTNSLGMKFRRLPDSPVMMSVWETRVCDWNAFLQWQKEKISWNYRPAFTQTAEHPVVNIALGDATMFCEWLTKLEQAAGLLRSTQRYRLPTGSEWDSAVGFARKERGGTRGKSVRFPWGDNWPPMRQSGNYNFRHMQAGRDDGFSFTAPVGQFMPVAGGFYDLGGNVWEWTRDATTRPLENAILRGGSWMYWRQDCLESGYEYSTASGTRSPTIGFRCVFEDTEKAAEHRNGLEHAEAQMRFGLTAKRSEVSEDEVARVKAEMQERHKRKQEVDPAERAKLMKKPTIDQNEIDEFRKALNGPQDAGTNSDDQKLPPAIPVEPGN